MNSGLATPSRMRYQTHTPRLMKRIEKVYRIAELLFTDPILQWIESRYPESKFGKNSFYVCLVMANSIISIADDPATKAAKSPTQQDLVDEIQRPFEILEHELKSMRLDESSEWENE